MRNGPLLATGSAAISAGKESKMEKKKVEKANEEAIDRFVESAQDWIEVFGYTVMVFVFFAVSLTAFVAPIIDDKTAEKINSARIGIKHNVAIAANANVEDIHYRRDGEQYFVSVRENEVLVTDQKVQKIIVDSGVKNDAMVDVPGRVVVYSFAGAGTILFFVIALAKKRKESSGNTTIAGRVTMGSVVKMTLMTPRSDVRAFLNNDDTSSE